MAAIRKVKGIRQFIAQVSDYSEDEEKELVEELEDVAADIIHLDHEGDTLGETDTDVHGFIASNEGEEFMGGYAAQLGESSDVHALTKHLYKPKRYGRDTFQGVMVDTGCARGSSAGEDQYMAY